MKSKRGGGCGVVTPKIVCWVWGEEFLAGYKLDYLI